mgnify:CR=1 FL=1
MAYVQIPRDLNKIKEKFLFGLPKRQVIYFGIGIAIGLIPFFILINYDLTAAVIVLMLCIMPFGFFGMYEKNGLTCDKLLVNWIKANFIRPKIRPYKTENLYVALEEQYFIDKEAKRIGYKKGFSEKLEEAIQNIGSKKRKKHK